ncbi:MAG: gamma carbonic anhydrase family protein [Opitutales bacterium]|nr:gamma carbonic anhydrase family protein [Opitutales bacterium]
MTEPEKKSLESCLEKFLSREPVVPADAYLAETAVLIGAVTLGAGTNIWPNAVLRADIDEIKIGAGTSIQDGVCIHVAENLPTIVGDYVTVGHSVTLHACTIGNECLIGMGATVLDGAVIGDRCIVAAGTVVPPRMVVPAGTMVAGIPATIKKNLSQEAQSGIRDWAERYVVVSAAHKRRQNTK